MGEIRNWEELSEEEKGKMRLVYGTILKLKEFYDFATPNTFNKIFGEQLGEHLREVFYSKCQRDVLKFVGQLSSDNRAKFTIAVFDNTDEKNPIYI